MSKMKILCSQFQTGRKEGRKVQRMRNIIVILALFACTSICLGQQTIWIAGDNIDEDGEYGFVYGNGDVVTGRKNRSNGEVDKDPIGNTVNITTGATNIGNVFGAYMNDDSEYTNGTSISGPMTDNKVNVFSINHGCGDFGNNDIYGACSQKTTAVDVNDNKVEISGGFSIRDVFGGRTKKGTVSSNTVTISSSVKIRRDVCGGWIDEDGYASSNTVTITSGAVHNVFGGYIVGKGTATLNEVNLTSVTVSSDVYGARIGNGLAEDNKVRIDGNGKIEGEVYGGYIEENGTATINKVNLTSVTVISNVYGARIGNGLASSNTVTIISGAVYAVLGGYIEENGTATLNEVNLTSVTVSSDVYGARIGNGLAEDNKVRIDGNGKIEGNVFGGYIYEKGTATLNEVHLTSVTVKRDVYGAQIGYGLAEDNKVRIDGNGKIEGEVYGGYIHLKGTATENKVNLTSVTVDQNVYGAQIGNGLASSNTVTIKGGKVGWNVYGGYIVGKGTATINKVHLTSATVGINVFGAQIGNGLASSNTVTIISGAVQNVVGGCILANGTATLNEVNLTSVTVTRDIFGGKIGIDALWMGRYGDGLASSNTVTITSGKIEGDIFGGYIGRNGTATLNTVTINGGKIGGNVFGGYVGGNGEAIHNTITITGSAKFSTATILCGGVATNDAFTGNTLNIETKGVVVNGISNFEKYNFHLKDIKPGEVILTATSGGCSWDVVKLGSTTACTVDLSRSNIHLRTQSVLNKGECCTLIKSPQGFKDNGAHKQFSFDNGGLVEYHWEIRVADNKQDLMVMLKRKELREGKAKPLLEGNVTGMVCINNGMDCIISKMEETESVLGEGAKLQRKGEIGAFYGLLANKSSYDDTGSHIDMAGMSMMGGIGIRWKGLVTGAFGEYGTGNSDIDSGSCSCEKKSEGKSNYVGGGLLGRYNVCEDEFRGTKLYLEAILRAGEVSNTFNIKEAKDGAEKECKYNDETTTYGGCALGGGYKHKLSEKIDVDWSLRYMFGYQDGKDVEKPVDAYGNKVKLESVTSSRIRVGVRGKYVELEKVKPYIGIWYEHELSGKVKGAIQNGVDNVGDIPATSFEGGTGIGELGVSGKIGKLDVGISGQGYLGVRKGFGGMLKLKYAFGKDAYAKPQPKDYEKETVELESEEVTAATESN